MLNLAAPPTAAARRRAAIAALPASALRDLALAALDNQAPAPGPVDHHAAEARGAAFWRAIDAAAAMPARTAQDAAAKAAIIAALADRECTDEARRLADSLAADLVRMG
jgi:hypothetical protein